MALMLGYVTGAVQLAALSSFTPRATLSKWDVVIPRSCANDAMRWTNGHSLEKMPIEEFLRIKRLVEGCGGVFSLEPKQDPN